jgi:hypothetical protein
VNGQRRQSLFWREQRFWADPLLFQREPELHDTGMKSATDSDLISAIPI